jgi:hypothetical protein
MCRIRFERRQFSRRASVECGADHPSLAQLDWDFPGGEEDLNCCQFSYVAKMI